FCGGGEGYETVSESTSVVFFCVSLPGFLLLCVIIFRTDLLPVATATDPTPTESTPDHGASSSLLPPSYSNFESSLYNTTMYSDGNSTDENSTDWTSTAIMEASSMMTEITTVVTENSTTSTAMNYFSLMRCQNFTCTGVNCYQNQTGKSCNAVFSFLQLFRETNTSYNAGCNQTCAGATRICSTPALTDCVLECCNSSLCLWLNGTVQEVPANSSEITHTTAATTTKVPTNVSGMVCDSFTCNGADCYKTQAKKENCMPGYNYCEMKKFLTGGVQFVAGCSKTCNNNSNTCTSTSKKDCLYECCKATKTSCLKLDGKVYAIGAADIVAPLMSVIACTVVTFLFNSYIST
uniref:Uncharacterized protein n=1 Tax=Latimeria chalumnae TaxID=7897 RepID=H3AJS9_LATCH